MTKFLLVGTIAIALGTFTTPSAQAGRLRLFQRNKCCPPPATVYSEGVPPMGTVVMGPDGLPRVVGPGGVLLPPGGVLADQPATAPKDKDADADLLRQLNTEVRDLRGRVKKLEDKVKPDQP